MVAFITDQAERKVHWLLRLLVLVPLVLLLRIVIECLNDPLPQRYPVVYTVTDARADVITFQAIDGPRTIPRPRNLTGAPARVEVVINRAHYDYTLVTQTGQRYHLP